MAIVLVSDELEEYALCDRVLVLFGGAVVREFPTTPPATELLAAVEGVKWEA
jgi:ABC-type sugar transport system ATPase subunit